MKLDKVNNPKHFIDINKIGSAQLKKIVDVAKKLKEEKFSKNFSDLLKHKNIAMIFEKNSTRTRVSFEVAINQLGGNAIVMNKQDMQLGKETVEDTAKVLSRYVNGIVIRSQSHKTITELADNSSVSVINALSDFSHPCQIIASIQAIEESIGSIGKKKLAWFGDQNNVLNSYIQAAKFFDYELSIASPKELDFSKDEIIKAVKNGAKINQFNNPKDAAKNADVLITDTWISMGENAEKNQTLKEKKIKQLLPFQVNLDLFKLANKKAIFTHCLPAYRGFEVSNEVIDSKKSIVFEEAENRLHAQKSILIWLFSNNY
jgi:ornithine carbamoyltransferase